MPFIKTIKTRAYHKRFQVKFRRRREGKTDYYARKRMVVQDKNKYNTPKYRLVVRFTTKRCICQIVAPALIGDRVMVTATSDELKHWGLTVGLKNYSAAYCTGLLVARRLLVKLGMDKAYPPVEDVTGKVVSTKEGKRTFYVPEIDDDVRPFRCVLDVGLRATTNGANVFGAMKGAVDGGLDVPHSCKRFPGYDEESKKYDAGVHRGRIFGEHVADYMKTLMEEDEAKYQSHFAEYIKAGMGPDDLEDMYEEVHKKIRADPTPKPREEIDYKTLLKDVHARRFPKKRTLAQRKARIAQKIAAHERKMAGDAPESSDEESD
jgi:large subunit ribosomal protein L5e